MIYTEAVEIEVSLDDFDSDEILDYVKENFQLLSESDPEAPYEAIEALRQIKRHLSGVGDWINIRPLLMELIEE